MQSLVLYVNAFVLIFCCHLFFFSFFLSLSLSPPPPSLSRFNTHTHTQRVSVRNSGKVFSAPQTVQQVALVRDILAVNETTYGPAIHRLRAHHPVLRGPDRRRRGGRREGEGRGGKPHPLPVHVTGGVLITPRRAGRPAARPAAHPAAHGGTRGARGRLGERRTRLTRGRTTRRSSSTATARTTSRAWRAPYSSSAPRTSTPARRPTTPPSTATSRPAGAVPSSHHSVPATRQRAAESRGNFITRKLRPPRSALHSGCQDRRNDTTNDKGKGKGRWKGAKTKSKAKAKAAVCQKQKDKWL